jgi:outer membrane biosynthesis protein TonB
MGNEMLVELSALLDKYDITKEAAKKDDKEGKEKEKAKKEKEKEKEKAEKDKEKAKKEKEKEKAKKEKEKKDSKKKKKGEIMVDVLEGLSKLATELDSIGAEEASGLVDDALRIIVKNMEQADAAKKS